MKRLVYLAATLVVLQGAASCSRPIKQIPPSCSSPIYCYGELLHTIQINQIFDDSKTFVDYKMKQPANETLKNFQLLMESTNQNPTKPDLLRFVGNNFENGSELEMWTPTDYTQNPKFLEKIVEPTWKTLATALVEIWPTLARRIKPEVLENPELYSLIPVTHGFIVPGGRFREFYYWDTYWIVKGLLLSEMKDTVRGMLDNFLSMVDRYGFVPNGGRVYYTERTQPPMLTPMALNYFIKSKDSAWLQANIDTLDRELMFFLENRTIEIIKDNVKYLLGRYNAVSAGPRPESYFEDFQTAESVSVEQREKTYIALKSGAESGWDFSSRWVFDPNENAKSNLSFINTTRVIPVDLNAFLCGAFNDLGTLYMYLGNHEKMLYWKDKAQQWMSAIEGVLWNEELGVWFDWDWHESQHRTNFYVSNVTPLWTKCLPTNDLPVKGKRALSYLKSIGVLNFNGGTPTSMDNSGEQWDFPNAWPPLQAIMIQSLENTGVEEAVKMAKDLAVVWIHANFVGYNATEKMYEKYDCLNPGETGGGGEYSGQTGFGWTNGVALELIDHYSPEALNQVTHPASKARKPRY